MSPHRTETSEKKAETGGMHTEKFWAKLVFDIKHKNASKFWITVSALKNPQGPVLDSNILEADRTSFLKHHFQQTKGEEDHVTPRNLSKPTQTDNPDAWNTSNVDSELAISWAGIQGLIDPNGVILRLSINWTRLSGPKSWPSSSMTPWPENQSRKPGGDP
ncbi:hypothetical protein NDU88_009843 [Pleurodeles waltl]|uniref:Uncharacterized protein n=1 Tax=Pleurodeles waltl TaxID=8319 RepID=A0AAV7PWG3_PLEWA|nr:hypothetical protein NDU88_009843 [Pleurodeles waltl]